MSIKLLKSPFEHEFRSALSRAKRDIVFSSPYINEIGASIFLDSVRDTDNKRINILTNLSVRNIIDDVTQPAALLKLCSAFQETTVSSLEKLHAKVYIIDEVFAVVTSANLTAGGLRSNFEYGVMIDDKETIRTIKRDILDYASIGHIFDTNFLTQINEASQKIERAKEKRTANASDLKFLIKQQQKIDELLISRYSGKETRHGIFVKTIEFLLRKHKQLSTENVYAFVQDIHPEMCDDNTKYSNGEKKWKIEVRQAMFALKKKNAVVMNNIPNSRQHIWSLTK